MKTNNSGSFLRSGVIREETDASNQERLKKKYNISENADIRIEKPHLRFRLSRLFSGIFNIAVFIFAFIGALVVEQMIIGNDIMTVAFAGAIRRILQFVSSYRLPLIAAGVIVIAVIVLVIILRKKHAAKKEGSDD